MRMNKGVLRNFSSKNDNDLGDFGDFDDFD